MYRAPVEEIAFTLKHVAGLQPALDAGTFGDLTEDLVDAILAEAGRFATEEVAPLTRSATSRARCSKDAAVTMPPGWKDLYRRWTEGGWNALSGPEEFGGQGAADHARRRRARNVELRRRWPSRIGPTLTMGAVEALDKHASDELKADLSGKARLRRMDGHDEPDRAAGRLRPRRAAAPAPSAAGDGTYRIFGQKIFITYGEHDLTDNIVHLVLARLPDAPAGTRGISLFLVPKFLVDDDGSARRAQRRLLLLASSTSSASTARRPAP